MTLQEVVECRTDLPQCPNMLQCRILKAYNELKKECDRLKKLSMKDELTGYYNYAFLMNTLNCEMERTRRSGLSTSIIMADIDYFKKINDKFGHESGNAALQWVTRVWRQNIRKVDFPCRYGGEEFIFILPNETLKNAVNTAERLRKKIESQPLIIENTPVNITASFGVEEYSAHRDDNAEHFIRQADQLLYKAKKSGRNRTYYDKKRVAPHSQQLSAEERNALFSCHHNDR